MKTLYILTLLFLAVLLGLFPSQLCADGIAVLDTDEVSVHYARSAQRGAEAVVDHYPNLKRAVEERLGLGLQARPTIVLMNNSRAFRDYVGNSLIVAVAQPHNNRIVIDYGQVIRRPFSLDSVLKHELCHLILHQNIAGNSLPKWLDEGIAQWVSDGITEVVLTGGRELFDQAVVAGATIPLRRLSNYFPPERDYLLLAYEQSKSFVAFLIDEYGEDRLQMLLHRLKEGNAVNEAVQETFRRSLGTLESTWLANLKRKGVWFTYLSSHMYEFLFVAAALATIFGFLRFLKKRRFLNEMEGEDEW